MTGFNFVAPETTDQNAPQIDQDLQQRRRAAAERSYAGPLPETPEQRNKNVMRSFNAVFGTDASATRLARRMAQEANIPEDVALADPKFAESVLQQREMERRDLWNRNPTVARFYEDVEFAKIASDDLDSLVRTDGFLNAYWMGRQVASGWQQQEQGEIWYNILSRGGKKTLGESFQLEEINRDLARQKDEEGLTGGIFNVVGQISNSTLYAAPAAWAGAKAGAAFGPGGAAAGAAVAGRLAVFARSAYVERGRKYGELRDLGLSHEEAEKSSLGYGLAAGALEATGWGFLSAPARKMILEGAAKKISTALSGDLLKTARRRMLTDTLKGSGYETLTEVSQTIAGYFTDRWSIESSGMDVEAKAETLEGLQSLGSQLSDTIIQTLKSIGPLSAVFPAIRLSRESRLARDAMRGSKLIQDIVDTSGNSKLAEEAPESYARVLNEQAKAAGVETVYVDPETFEQVLNEADKADLATRAQEAGVSVEEMQKQVQQAGTGTRAVLDQKMPEVMSRVAEAKAAGEQLEIPMAKFNEVFRNTRVLALLVKHVKLQRTGRTAAQAQAFEEAKLQLKQEADKAIDENASEREKLLDGVDDLKSELMDSFNVAPKPEQATDAQGYPTQRGWQGMPMIKVQGEKAVPMSKEDANVAVEWVSNAAIVGAAEDKVSVREWWAANKFRVMQKLQPSAQAPAAQRPVAGAAQPTAPATPATAPATAPTAAPASTAAPAPNAAPASTRESIGNLGDILNAWSSTAAPAELTQQQPDSLQAAGRKSKDAAYLDAVSRGDTASMRRAVEVAAKEAGYTVEAWHGTTVTKTTDGKEIPGDKSAYEQLAAIAKKYNIKDSVFDVANKLETWIELGLAEELNVSKEDAVTARALTKKARGSYTASSEQLLFSEFEMSPTTELGAHFGTKQQAERFGTPFQFFISVTNPLRMKDLGGWQASKVIKEAKKSGVDLFALKSDKTEFLSIESSKEQNAWVRNKLLSLGYDGIVYNNEVEGKGDSYIILNPQSAKSAELITRDDAGNVIPLSQRFNQESPSILYAEGAQNPQGAYFPRTNTIELYEAATLTTFLHEASHWWLTTLFARARAEGASSAVQKKMQMVFNALGVKDMEAWDALPIERKEALHEAFSYNFESYLLEGKAPTEEQRGLFATIARWTRRLYSNLRDTLAVTYEREYGEQLPMMSNELRQVFDRMTATEEQIEATELLRDLTPMFQTEQEALAAGMTPEEWLQFSANLDEAREAAFSRLATASLDQMKYLAGAISDKLASKQAEMSKERSKVRKEVESSVKLQKVYRVIRWLQTKIALDEQGNEFTPTLRNKIDVQEVVRYVMNGAIPNLKPPAKPSGSVRQDKDLLVQQEAKLEQLRASVTNAEARLEALRKEFKDLPRTPIEGLDQSQMLFQANKQMEDQRQAVNAAEAALAAFLPKVEEARQNYEKTRKKSKKTLLAEGMTEQQWEAEQADIDKQLPDEVKRVENLKASMQMVRDQLDSRGDKRTTQLQEKVEKFSKQLQEAEAVLKAAEDGYRQMSEKSKTVSEKDTKAFLKDLAAEADKVKRAQTKVAQKRSNLAKARVDVEAAQKRPTYTGSERDKLQSNLRNFAAQRKTAEDNLQAARARVKNEIAGLGEKEYKKAKAEQKKLQGAVTTQQEKLAKIEDGLKLSRRQKAAVQIRSLHRGLQSERTRLREIEQRVAATEKRIELNEPTLQGPVLDKLASMLTKKDGVSLQEVAALWGIPGGGPELLRMLFEAPAMQDAIESQTDEIMLERFGDYQSAEAAEGVVADAMHEEARTKLVATELQWLQSQLQRMMEDLDPDMKAAREASAAQLQLAEEKAAALSEALQKARETAMQNPEMQQLTEQKTTARTLATDAVKKSRENPQDSALAADAATKSAALNDILTKIDAAWGPDVQMAVQELEKAKEQVRVSKAEGRRAYVPVSTLVSAARAVAEDAIDNMEVGKISSAKHQAEEGRMNQKVMDALSSKRVKDKKGQPRVFKALEAKRLQLVQHMKAKVARVAEKKIAEIKGRMKRLFQSPQENIAKNYNTELYNAARAVAALYGFGPEVAVARAAEQLQAVSRYNPQMWERIQQIINPQVLQARTTGDYKKLTYSQLQDVDVLIKGMLEIARAERIVELGDRTIAIEEAQRQLTDSLSKHPKPFAAMGVAQSATKLQKFLKFWSNVKAWMRGMEQWTVAVDGGRGAWWDLVYNPIKSQINAYSVQRNKLVERYATMLSELEVEQDEIPASEIGYTFKNTAELLGAILHMGNMSNYRKLLLGRNWGVEQLGQLDDSKWKAFINRMHESQKLTKKHWDFAQGVWDMMEEIKPDLQKAHFKVFGYYFREVRYENIETPFGVYRGGYVPAKTDPMLVASHQSEENINEINGDMRSAVPAVQSGWANDRVEAYTKPLNLDLTMVLRHIDETVRFIHVQPTVQGVLRMIRPFEARNSALGAVDPEAYAELIIPWMVSAARQATSTRGSAFGTQVLDRLRRWSGMDALFGGVANAVGNLTAIPMAVRKLGVRAVMSGLRQYIVSSYSRAEGAERLSTWITMQSPFMDNRTRGKMLEMAQMLDALVSNPGAYKKLKRMANKNAYFLQTFFQNISDMAIWKGAYDTYQDKHDVSAMTPEQIHAEAVKYADYMVRDNSPSLSPEDQAKLLKGGPFMRLMLQFGGYFNWLFNVNTTDFGNLIREVGLLRTPLTARFYQQLILGYAAPLFVADAIMQMFSGAFFDDEDDEELTSAIGEKVLVSVGRGTASMFPFVGQVSLALYGLTTEDPNDERITNAPAVNYIMRAGRGAVAAGREVGEALGIVDFEKEVTGREVRDMFGLLSIITGGLPTSVLGKPAQFMTDVSNDRYDDPDFVQWTQGVMSGKASGASR